MQITVYPGCHPFAEGSQPAELSVFGRFLGTVRYAEELSGKTDLLSKIAKKSGETQGVAAFLFDTATGGGNRHSAALADCGKVLGISDELYVSSEGYRPGSTVKVYDTSVGKVGLLVGNDLYFSKPAEALSLCDCDLILHLSRGRRRETALLAAANSYLSGVPLLSAAEGVALLALPEGELAFSTPKEGFCHRISLKRRAEEVLTFPRKGGE